MAATIIQQKRFTNEKALLAKEPLHYTTAYPDKENPLIWYCLIIGQKGTPYYGGHYIYKVHHSPKYPAEPPDYYFLTPSGRYEVDKKICLTNSSYHKGEWSSTWNIKTILISFYSIFLDDKEHGISHIVPDGRHSIEALTIDRKEKAKLAIEHNKKHYSDIYSKFDFTHLADDAPSVPAPAPVPAPVVAAVPVPVIVVPEPTPTPVVVPEPEPVIPKNPIPEVGEEVKPKKGKKVAKKNINIIEEPVLDTGKYESMARDIKEMDTKLKEQFADIENLEKGVKMPKLFSKKE
jgi:ubiquitin-protein ligase